MDILFRRACQASVTLILCVGSAHASDKNLCKAEEKVFFSCTITPQVASVCEVRDAASGNTYLQYRFSANGRRLALQYPRTYVPPSAAFETFSTGGPKWSNNQLQFSIGEVHYAVYAERAVFDASEGGVIAKKDGTTVAHFFCSVGNLNDSRFEPERFKIPRAKNGVDTSQ